ncbi:hypothetical protein K504DRAFT_368738 [Pleomassaria siparia CBS 279.74]|uniref:T6SS Phospholipase effector Tle1-like catalytic domain-containing protein n=1 Tax=Pleomassaria siparia CBS 279.74 TaxID=1314801 RepID=A0A6G1KM13_9PLEO|nr:hypothetical protein K504DRAFT_368738 [Pleomassaria siparia CBS 279.74]
MASSTPTKRLAIFCDGTWCGRETRVPGAPPSNILMLASMVGNVRFLASAGELPTAVHPIHPHNGNPNIVAGYQEGVGLNKTFLEYLWDGATASTIGEECISVYKFIVDNYTDEHEIWMFGLSRGAYTVRCVAGMINNCGIIKKAGLRTDDIATLCEGVYRAYRSPLPIDHPGSDRCKRLRENSAHVWPVLRPIRFMGLFDTVGGLGIPRIDAGVGFDWPEFYDQDISSVVQDVYHAVSLHDRLWLFQPCLAFEGKGEWKAKVTQKWFPGTHYDLGRQTFRFVRQAPNNQIEKYLGVLPDLLSKTIFPNQVLSDLVLRWMVESTQTVSATSEMPTPIIRDVRQEIRDINDRLAYIPPSLKNTYIGSGDIYGSPLSYAPAGSLYAPLLRFGSKVVGLLNKVWPQLGDNIQDLLGIKTILRILTATRDRRIPGDVGDEAVYKYKDREEVFVDDVGTVREIVIGVKAGLAGEGGRKRYPSRTFESWGLWRRVFDGT